MENSSLNIGDFLLAFLSEEDCGAAAECCLKLSSAFEADYNL